MPYKSPVGKLATKRKKNIKDPPLRIPDAIRLPDGRTVDIQAIVNKITDKTNYNLRLGMSYGHSGKRKMIKAPVDCKDKE